MKKLSFILVAVWVAALTTVSGQAATVYVSQSTANGYAVGNDGNTYAQALNTSSPWLTLTHALASVTSGDTIVINDGTYVASSTYIVGVLCTINALNAGMVDLQVTSGSCVLQQNITGITIGAVNLDANNVIGQCYTANAGTFTVTFTGTKFLNPTTCFSYCNIAGVVMKGCTASATLTMSANDAFRFQSGATGNFDIENCTVTMIVGSNRGAFLIYNTSTSYAPTLTMKNNIMNLNETSSYGFGILAYGFTTYDIESNVANVTGVSTRDSGTRGFIYIQASAIATTSCVIKNNTALNAYFYYGINVGGDGSGSANNNIAGAIVSGNSVSMVDHGIIVNYIVGTRVYDNCVANSFYGVIAKGTIGAVIYNNIIDGCAGLSGTACLYAKYGTADMFSNNTVYTTTSGSSQYCLSIGPDGASNSSNEKYSNNIIYNAASTPYFATVAASNTGSFINNLYYNINTPASGAWSYQGNNYSSLSTWQAAGYDSGSFAANPQFVNGSSSFSQQTDFYLSANSPAVNSGLQAGAVSLTGAQTDGFGVLRFFAPYDRLNIGADQNYSDTANRKAGLNVQ